jgi:hypothetical protein
MLATGPRFVNPTTARRPECEGGSAGHRMRQRVARVMGLLLLGAAPALAEPTAIVEEIEPSIEGIEVMALLEPGEVVALDPKGHLVLGYLANCARESITGGRVVIGREQSIVEDGKVERTAASCPSASARTTQRVQVMAGIVVRSLPKSGDAAPPVQQQVATVEPGAGPVTAARLAIGHTVPIILLPSTDAVLEIRRLDIGVGSAADGFWRLRPSARLLDLGDFGVRLEPGASYVVSHGDHSMRLDVAASAHGDDAPPLSRLVRF